jgi:RNA polymerase sigma-70 factor (ECF subfamily)
VSEAPPEFQMRHRAALARLCRRAGAARWNLGNDALAEAAFRGARAAGIVDAAGVEQYLDSLHAVDLALALACRDGNSAAWEHFITTCRPQMYSAARAIAGDEVRGRELADSIWADMYGLDVRGGRRRSLLDYFHGRSSILTWIRAVLAQRHVDYVRSQNRFQQLDDRFENPGRDAGSRAAKVEDEPREAGSDRARYVAMLGEALESALKSLEPKERLRMAYYYRHNLSLKEIGALMGEHESSVSRKLARTRDELKSSVERALRDRGKLSRDQIQLCYDFAAGDLRLDLARALPEAK